MLAQITRLFTQCDHRGVLDDHEFDVDVYHDDADYNDVDVDDDDVDYNNDADVNGA